MQVRELMSSPAIGIHPAEPVCVAARTLERYNIGALPVWGSDGKLCGMVTDRDLVTRCVAAGKDPQRTPVREVMTRQVICAQPEMECAAAAHLMGRRQVRRLPVVAQGRVCGMLSLGDLAAREESAPDATDALGDIAANPADTR